MEALIAFALEAGRRACTDQCPRGAQQLESARDVQLRVQVEHDRAVLALLLLTQQNKESHGNVCVCVCVCVCVLRRGSLILVTRNTIA